MKQPMFPDPPSGIGIGKTRREEFLDSMNDLIPWDEWVALVKLQDEPDIIGLHPPGEIQTLLRMYLLQAWFDLSDENVQDCILDSAAMRKFMGDGFRRETAPDAASLLRFRERLEESFLGRAMFDAMNRTLKKNGLRLCGGSIAEAAIIEISSEDEKTCRQDFLRPQNKSNIE